MQEVCRKFTVKVDSDHAGCLLTGRYSTGLAAFRGSHCLRTASTTQSVVALSSGESELYSLCKGTAAALGLRPMAHDLGMEATLELQTDAVAGKGMAIRLGADNIEHIATQ